MSAHVPMPSTGRRSWRYRLGATAAGLLLVIAVIVVAWILLMAAREETPPVGSVPVDAVVYDAAYATAAAEALRILQQAQANRHFPSVALAVGVDGKLVWAAAAGYEEVATGKPATVDSRYYIASIAKFFTSVALGKLVETGAVDLDAEFSQLVPDFPPFAQDFTLRQLQQHQAGIRHWRVRDVFNQTYYTSVQQAALDLANEDLLFEPGTATSYSTPGYTLLALAMESAADQDYLALIQQLVFDPAGMRDTFADTTDRPSLHVVVPYLVADEAMVRVPAFNMSDRWAGGGFLATPADVVRFGNAVLAGDMISEDYREVLLRRAADEQAFYPRTFAEEQSSSGLKLTGGGSGWSGRASLSLYPERGVVVAIATNTRPADDQGPGIDENAIAALFAVATD